MSGTRVIWSKNLQARIRVEVPGTPGYDKDFWEFVDPADELRHTRDMAKRLVAYARRAKADARRCCEDARASGGTECSARHLRKAEELIRTAWRLGNQARAQARRADALQREFAQ